MGGGDSVGRLAQCGTHIKAGIAATMEEMCSGQAKQAGGKMAVRLLRGLRQPALLFSALAVVVVLKWQITRAVSPRAERALRAENPPGPGGRFLPRPVTDRRERIESRGSYGEPERTAGSGTISHCLCRATRRQLPSAPQATPPPGGPQHKQLHPAVHTPLRHCP